MTILKIDFGLFSSNSALFFARFDLIQIRSRMCDHCAPRVLKLCDNGKNKEGKRLKLSAIERLFPFPYVLLVFVMTTVRLLLGDNENVTATLPIDLIHSLSERGRKQTDGIYAVPEIQNTDTLNVSSFLSFLSFFFLFRRTRDVYR